MERMNTTSSVFIEDNWSIADWKSCIFFWKKVYVYESFILNVGRNDVSDEELLELTKTLLKKGILKIAMPEGYKLKEELSDKVYAGMDEELYDFLWKNADKTSIDVILSDDYKGIAKRTADKEYQDAKLCELMDSLVYKRIEEEVLAGSKQSKYGVFFSDICPDEHERIIKELIDDQYSHYKSRSSDSKYHFQPRNKKLFEKNSISSSILTSKYQLPYYQYKFDNFKNSDANYYIQAVNASMRFIKKDSIDELNFEELLKIRNKPSWKKAMTRLGDICKNIKYTENIDEYKMEVTNELISEYQSSLDEYRVSERDLAKDIIKDVALTGMSFVPVVGPVVSEICSRADYVASYLEEKENQKNLAFFLTDLSKKNY
jgi:hypothetical protein